MRSLEADFAAHIADELTTLCWCWRVVRKDGTVLGFTDHDRTLDFAGTPFAPATGLETSEATERSGAQTQTTEVLGVLSSTAINEDDIVLGRYDGARVETWRVNWAAPDERVLMRTDTIGEITREDGVFRAELRSGQHALNVRSGRFFHHVCDARLGDARCGVALDAPALRTEAVVATVAGATLTVSGLTGYAPGWFSHGHVRWISGRRAGLSDAIIAQNGTRLQLARPVAEWVAPGDGLLVYAGCDRTFETCRTKFANGDNFRGFPHIPGNDALMRYPDPEDALDGAPRVR